MYLSAEREYFESAVPLDFFTKSSGPDSVIVGRNWVCFHITLNNTLICVQPMREGRKKDVRDYLLSLSAGTKPSADCCSPCHNE